MPEGGGRDGMIESKVATITAKNVQIIYYPLPVYI